MKNWTMGLVLALCSITATAQVPGQEWVDSIADVAPVTLNDGDMKRMVKTLKALEAAEFDSVTSQALTPAAADIANNAEAMRILSANGYSAERFASHMQNIGMAMIALQVRDNRAEIEASLADMEEMRSMVPAEQFESMQQSITTILAMADRAPAGNIELVRKYVDEFEAIGN